MFDEKDCVTNYDKLLYALLVNNMVRPSSLALLSKNPLLMYRAIKKGLKNKHIKKYKLTICSQKPQKLITFYGIARDGLVDLSCYCRYTGGVFPEAQFWVAFLPNDEEIGHLTIFSSRKKAAIYQNLLLSTANVFFGEVQAEIFPISSCTKRYDTFYVRMGILSWLVREALAIGREIYEKIGLNDKDVVLNNGAEIKFYNAKEIEREFFANKSDNGNLFSDNVAGVVESPSKSMLVYVGGEMGMSWESSDVENDKKVYLAFNHLSAYHSISSDRADAVLIVENKWMFEDLFFDKMKRRKGCALGNGLDSLIVVPNSFAGVKNFREFFLDGEKTSTDRIEMNAVNSGNFVRRQGYDDVFSLEDKNGVSTYVGVFMDVIKIQKLQNAVEALRKPYQIMCYQWQEDFYRRVFPDAGFVVMDSSSEDTFKI